MYLKAPKEQMIHLDPDPAVSVKAKFERSEQKKNSSAREKQVELLLLW